MDHIGSTVGGDDPRDICVSQSGRSTQSETRLGSPHILMTLVDPYMVCEENTHAMTLVVVSKKNTHATTLVDPCVVSEKNTHFNDNGGSVLGV